MKVKILRIAGFFGIAAPLSGFTMIFLSIRVSPWFSWTGNALSNLGVRGFGSILFNSGLIITGALMLVFSLGLFELARVCRVGRLGSAIFMIGAFFLCGIGVFPETAGRIHYYLSVAFFVSLPLALFALGVCMALREMKRFGLLSFASGSVAAGVWLLQWSSAAIPEAISALSVSVWSSALGLWMLWTARGINVREKPASGHGGMESCP